MKCGVSYGWVEKKKNKVNLVKKCGGRGGVYGGEWGVREALLRVLWEWQEGELEITKVDLEKTVVAIEIPFA